MSNSLDCHILWIVTCWAPLSSTISRSLFKFISIESVMLSNHFILFQPLLLLPLVFLNDFPMSQLLASGGQSIGAPASATILPMKIKTCLSSCSPRDSQGSSLGSSPVWKHLLPGSNVPIEGMMRFRIYLNSFEVSCSSIIWGTWIQILSQWLITSLLLVFV